MSDELGFRIVGVGASAGGLEALEHFFGSAEQDLPAAFLVVQHLSPDHKSLMADILGKRTRLPVAEAADGQRIQRGHVYVIPPRRNLSIEGDRLRLVERASPHAINLPVDLLFRALAEQQGENAFGVVLSGTGSDGRAGVEAIKGAGGVVLVQDPQSARFDGMPLSAISTGLADFILPPERMIGTIVRLTVSPPHVQTTSEAPPGTAALGEIYQSLKRSSGVDFSEYKPSTVLRRIERRMGVLGLERLDEYARRLTADPPELVTLGRELLISVTRFFRDEEVWTLLANRAIVDLINHAEGKDPIRAWVVGCATGQEAYTIAMLFTEQLEALGKSIDFKVFATDIDRDALEVASAGQYADSLVADVSPERLKRFFERQGDGWVVDRVLRRHIVFAPHNVARDPPFTKIDLLTCRNVLIYLGSSLQRRVLSGFSFSLRPDGYLLLGTSESLGDLAERFRPVDPHSKIYQRLPGARPPFNESMSLVSPAQPRAPAVPALSEEAQAVETAFRILMETVAPTSVLVREDLQVVSVFGNASQVLRVPVGSASLSLAAMLPDSLRTVTQLACARALSTREEQTFAAQDVSGVTAVRVKAFTLGRSGRQFLVIVFGGLDRPTTPVLVNSESREQVAELQREVQFVREGLQATIEELETSNEELQSTNEELLAANEELQSTNEELQSLNEELNTVNAEHQARISDLTAANADLDNFFKSSAIGILFLDDGLRIRRFTPTVRAQLNVLERDIGRPVEHLATRLQAPGFLDTLRSVLAGGGPVEQEVGTDDGGRALMRVVPYVSEGRTVRGVVVSFLDITQLRLVQAETVRLQSVIDSLPEQVAVLDGLGVVQVVNESWRSAGVDGAGRPGLLERPVPGVNYLELLGGVPAVRAGIASVLEKRERAFRHDYRADGEGGAAGKAFVLSCTPLRDAPGAVISHIDVALRSQGEGAR